jgi:hypothetical protein
MPTPTPTDAVEYRAKLLTNALAMGLTLHVTRYPPAPFRPIAGWVTVGLVSRYTELHRFFTPITFCIHGPAAR